MKSIRILIADDHPVVRVGLEGMLASQPDFIIVGEAHNGLEALTLTASLQPDLVLMDLRMAIMDGVTATTKIKQAFPSVAVLVLTTYDSDAEILHALNAGATGYLLKDAPREQLFAAIRAVAQGETALASLVTSHLLRQTQSPTEQTISARELEVLAQVAQGASNKEIARHLSISEATVKSHLIHIFNKLEVADRTAAVTVALKRGILRLSI